MRSRKYLSKVVVTVGEPGPHRNANAVRRTALLVLVSFVGLAAPSRSYAAVRSVCASGCKYTNIAAAIAAAKAGDTIGILDAVHTESNITIDRSLTIQGQGAAKTAVDGAQNGTVFTVDAGVTATFRNLTIRNGFNDFPSGGLYNQGGTVTISDSTLSDNGSLAGVGGLYNQGGTVTISNSTLSGNAALAAGGIAGALYNDGGMVTIKSSTLSANVSFDGPGGVYNQSGTVRISNSTLSGNGSARLGGAIRSDGTVTISNSTVSGNTADGPGGIFNDGILTISNSTVSGNTDMFSSGGGGIFNGGTVTILNSTLSGNSAPLGSGGAIFNGGTATISFSTLADNLASGGGGGLANFGNATLKNSIVGNNLSGDCSGTITGLGTNLDTDGSCGTTNFTQVTSAQLNLGPLAVNAPGTTATQALLPGSAAIEAVTDCTDVAENSVTSDQRGALRPDPGEVVCDIGAYEFQEFAGQARCERKSHSALVQQYGSLSAAASAYGVSTLRALEVAIRRSCAG